ncbi:MAG: hypothetical protein ABII12_13810 [Planctomycetota bacterium]
MVVVDCQANTLRQVARDGLRAARAETDPKKLKNAVFMSVVFAHMALEAYVNEIEVHCKIATENPALGREDLEPLVTVLEELEGRNLPLLARLHLVARIMNKARFDASNEPFQSVNDLNNIRNQIVHLKPIRMVDRKVLKRLDARGLLDPERDGVPEMWIDRFATVKVAEWAVNAAGRMIWELEGILGFRKADDSFKPV